MLNSLNEILNSPVLLSVAIITLLQYLILFVCMPVICVLLIKYVKKNKLNSRVLVILLIGVTLFVHSKVHTYVGQREIVYHRLILKEFVYDKELSGFLFSNRLKQEETIYQVPDSNVYVFLEDGTLMISNYSDVYSYEMNDSEIIELEKDSQTYLETSFGNLLNWRGSLNPLKTE